MRLHSPSPIRSPTYFKKVHLESGYHGLIWSFLFLINLLITFIACYYIIDESIGFKTALNLFSLGKQNYNDALNLNPDFYQSIIMMKKSIKLAILATFISNIAHLLYAFIFPKFYIQFYLIISLILSLIPAIILFIPQTSLLNSDYSIWGAIFALISAGIGILIFFIYQKYVGTSAELMKTSVRILAKHPSLIIVDIIQSILLLFITLIYSIIITILKFYSSEKEYSISIYAYGIFSYYWILMTVYYTCYMTTAGVIGFECYLGNSNSIPSNLVFFSFKRSITKNFGCAAFAGFILAVIQTLNFIVEYLNPEKRKEKKKSNENDDNNDDKKDNAALLLIMTILYYLFKFILSILESYFSYISRQALIYCAVYGCSYKEGCRRYHQNGFYDKMHKLQHESIISGATGTNYLLFMLLTGFIVYNLQMTAYNDAAIASLTVFLTEVFMLVFTFSNSLVSNASDTIFLCYLENPSAINLNHHNLYKRIAGKQY